jgi:hypothetical protein
MGTCCFVELEVVDDFLDFLVGYLIELLVEFSI